MKSGEFYYRPGVVQAVFDASVASFDTGDENATEEWIEEADSIVLTIDDTLSGDTKRKWREKDGGDCRVTVKALECLKIGYETSWPVNCLITDKSLYLYNRALVFLMQLSLARNALAKETLSFDKSCNGSNFGWKRQRNGLRRRMQVFCEGMVAFSMYYDLDKLNEHHLQFLIDICSHFFLLNEKAFVILRAIRKCLDMCLKFAETCARRRQ
ncbi:hypothetical protein BC830DRAFT_4441 [Chytriomyces sp. MP71]|nr:hypothetical protein BC830DRAFT_4441 [Chytriomyces sp. MP71]